MPVGEEEERKGLERESLRGKEDSDKDRHGDREKREAGEGGRGGRQGREAGKREREAREKARERGERVTQ
eukprot:1620399-Rhodomonas_salina.1